MGYHIHTDSKTKTERQWNDLGYKLKKDAVGEEMWSNSFCKERYFYYAESEVRKMTEKQLKEAKSKKSREMAEKRKKKAQEAEKRAYFEEELRRQMRHAIYSQGMGICSVEVDSGKKVFCYEIGEHLDEPKMIELYYKYPTHMQLEKGNRVVVPYGKTTKVGEVIEICSLDVVQDMEIDLLLKLREVHEKEEQ